MAQVPGVDGRVGERIGRLELELATALGMQHSWYHVDGSPAVANAAARLFAHLAGLGTVGQVTTEEELQVGVVVGGVNVLGRKHGGHLGYASTGHEPVPEQQVLHGRGPVQWRR